MNDLQILATIFVSCCLCGFFHYSGYRAGRQHNDWPAIGMIPLIVLTIAGVLSLIMTIIGVIFFYPPTP